MGQLAPEGAGWWKPLGKIPLRSASMLDSEPGFELLPHVRGLTAALSASGKRFAMGYAFFGLSVSVVGDVLSRSFTMEYKLQ